MMDNYYYEELMRRVLNRRKYNRYANMDIEAIEWCEKNVPKKTEILSEDDKELLEEYASKLFNGVDSESEILKGMMGLVKIFYSYRYDRSSYHILNDAKEREISYKNRKPKDKFEAFQKKAKKLENLITSVSKTSDELKKLFGSDTLHVHQKDFQLKKHLMELQEHNKKLQKQLQDAYINPEQYVSIIPKWKKNGKEDIESYLVNLNLQGKSKVIEAFANEIEKLT